MYIKCLGRLSQFYSHPGNDLCSLARASIAGFYRFFSASSAGVFSFGYQGRTVTLEFRGIPSIVKRRRNDSQYAATRRAVEATSSAVSSCDALALGVGMHEMAVIRRYLESQKFKDLGPRHDGEFRNLKQLIKRYRHYIDVASVAVTLGTHVIGVGRSKYAEAASFGEAATRSKIEVLRLLSLYLRKGNVLKDTEMLQEFKEVSPSIYQAVVEEAALYSFCRLHEHLYSIGDNKLSKRQNIRLLVVVDDWIVSELVHLTRTKLPILIADKSPPMVEVLDAIDNRSRQKWSLFLLQFVVMPMLVICGIFGYKVQAWFLSRGSHAPLHVGEGFGSEGQRSLSMGNHSQHPLNDTSRD